MRSDNGRGLKRRKGVSMTRKTMIALLLGAALLFTAAGCGEFVSIMPGTEYTPAAPAADEEGVPVFTEQGLLTFLGLDAFAESYYADTPVALSYQPVVSADGTRGCRSYVFDRASIISACDALRSMVLLGPTDQSPVSEAEFVLSRADGEEYRFSLGTLSDGSSIFDSGEGRYLVRGGETIWEIAFPAYSASFDLFDLYFSDTIRSFADNFFSKTPYAVGYRMASGATVTSDDPEVVEQAFRIMSEATVTVVENAPDQNIDLNQTRDYIFTMEDGTYYTFSFAEQCLAVKAVPGYDTIYYWLSGISALWDLPIMAENDYGHFAGGTVSELRDDIGQAAVVVNEGSETLSVAGVFVEYDIDGESGYLTLSEETAVSFLKEAFGVAVSDEKISEPSGSRITISVTLSDLSGPILYFTGDTIQQIVGVNYVCDETDMTSLRSTILELAAEGNNTAQVMEGATD